MVLVSPAFPATSRLQYSYLSRRGLADETRSLLLSNSRRIEPKALDVRVRRRSMVAAVATNFADLHHDYCRCFVGFPGLVCTVQLLKVTG